MMPAFSGYDVAYITTNASYRSQVGANRFYVVCDANRWNKVKLIFMALGLVLAMIRERPQVVISTGAAPGYVALRLGKLLGARTIWVDSIANVDELSLSGQKIGKHADLWLTQWPHLAGPGGPFFMGAVL
jgi:hypothetical protein